MFKRKVFDFNIREHKSIYTKSIKKIRFTIKYKSRFFKLTNSNSFPKK